jgi:mannose-6-phosphate isomerase-like protein (cupin superfamily)
LYFGNESLPAVPDEMSPGTRVTLTPGDAVSIPSESLYTLHHDAADQDVSAFAVAFESLSYNGPHVPQDSPTDQHDSELSAEFKTILASSPGNPAAQFPPDAMIAFGRITVPPGESIVFQEASDPTLLAIESGTLVLQVEHAATSLEHLHKGTATFVMSGAPFSLHNIGNAPAAAMVVTIVPSNWSPAPPP